MAIKLRRNLFYPPPEVPKTTVPRTPAFYRQGAEGCIAWTEDKVYIPIYPEGLDIARWVRVGDLPDEPNPKTGKSYKSMWEAQKEILREALRMEGGRFIYRLIVLCWMRGEGKSLLACIILLWKFFNWPRQQIMLGANSKDQVKFVHFDIMRDIILNSPELLAAVGDRNIQEKEIRLTDAKKNIKSIIRSISSFTGIVSNITGYSFSEIFDMKKPKFFTQLDGSIRNIPNAFGVIDSTVSDKLHILYQLFQNARMGKTKSVFFSYRYSQTGVPDEYWNPNMDKSQLDDYRYKFVFGDFERYFLNLWSAGTTQVFSDEMIEATKYLGVDGMLMNQGRMLELLEEKNKALIAVEQIQAQGMKDGFESTATKIERIYRRFSPVSNVYTLKGKYGESKAATIEDLNRLSDVFDTDWAVIGSQDFGDPYAVKGLARTILVITAKGLVGSRSNPDVFRGDPLIAPKYIYVILSVTMIPDHSSIVAKEVFDDAHKEYDGMTKLCSERYGTWDLPAWCEERDIEFEQVFPTYDKQREAFKEVLAAVKDGRLKCPELAVSGTKLEDIRDEEMKAFQHDAEKRWFGSPSKWEKYGEQDDFMFSLGWNLYGGRLIGVDQFRVRSGARFWGVVQKGEGLLGNYR
jgi:hypothetical protein